MSLYRNVSREIIRAADERSNSYSKAEKELRHYLIMRVKEVLIISNFCWAMGQFSLEVRASAPWYWWNGEDEFFVHSTYLYIEGDPNFQDKLRNSAYEALCRAGLQEQAEACFEILKVCEEFRDALDVEPDPIMIKRIGISEVEVLTDW